MTFSDAALVFLKRHIELPMQAVLNSPMAAHGFGKATRGKILAEDIVTDLVAFLAIADSGTNDDPNGLQARPARAIGQIVGHRTDKVIACLFTTVALVLCFMPTNLHAGEVVLQVIIEIVRDALVQRRLIEFHMED